MSDDYKKPWQREEEDDEMDETDYTAMKDAVLFAIDVSASMLEAPPPSDEKNADTDSPTTAALKCAYQIMQQRIISTPKDMMGILLFNTKETKFQEVDENSRGSLAYPHCYLLTDLDIPAANDVKNLKAIVANVEETQDLLVPSDVPVSMSTLFFCANQIFTTKAPNFASRRLFIITDNDDPHVKDKTSKDNASVRAKDLYDLGVVIELFPISRPGHEFDKTKFYDDIIYRDPNDESAVASVALKSSPGDGISLLASLILDINSKQTAKRTVFTNLPFELGVLGQDANGKNIPFKISVKGYNLLQRQRPARSCYVYEEGEVLQIAELARDGDSKQMVEGDTPQTVSKANIRKAYKFGGETVSFSTEEIAELKNFGEPVLRIIGFKPQDQLPFWAAVKKSTFIYPSEEDYIGSTRVFSALWQKLLKAKIMGIAWFIARKKAQPLLVAILPSAEKLDEVTRGQTFPAGLWLYPLPFADDLRYPPPQASTPLVASEKLIDKMNKIVQQLQLPSGVYQPSKYSNPALQWHYKILQAIALDEEMPEEKEKQDKTKPSYRQIQKRAGEYINAWGNILHEDFATYDENRRSHMKRDTDEADAKPAAKARKTAALASATDSLADMSMSELKKLVTNDGIKKYTVVPLKDLCTAKGMGSVTGKKKADLVEMIEQWIEENS